MIGVGIGTGVSSIGLDRIVFEAISLLLAATMYWAYFGVGEGARAGAALDRLPADRAQAAGLASYGYAFWVVLLGIVLSAAGLHHARVHPTVRLALGLPARARAWPAASCSQRWSWSEPSGPGCSRSLPAPRSSTLVLSESRAPAAAG